MTNRTSVLAVAKRSHSYFNVMRDFGKRGLEGFCQPERTRQNIIDMIRSGELTDIVFIHHVDGLFIEDVTAEILADVSLAQASDMISDVMGATQADRFDYARDLRKHEVA